MILAAGRGERLKPITNERPKAMCLVHQTPIIEYHIVNLAAAGFKRIIINHAYLGGQLRHYLGNGSHWGVDIDYTPEPPGGLETGGGIVNALPLLGEQPFITVNADIYTDYNFASIDLSIPSLAHLILINKPHYLPQGDFGLSKSGHLQSTNKRYTFAGIACYRPELFADLKLGRYSMSPLLHQLTLKQEITGEIYQGMWFDIGSPEQLINANSQTI